MLCCIVIGWGQDTGATACFSLVPILASIVGRLAALDRGRRLLIMILRRSANAKRLRTKLCAYSSRDTWTNFIRERFLEDLHFRDPLVVFIAIVVLVIIILILTSFVLFTLLCSHLRSFMFLSALALLPELITLISFLSNIEDGLVWVLTHLARTAAAATTLTPTTSFVIVISALS